MAETIILSDEMKQKSKNAATFALNFVITAAALFIFPFWRFFKNAFKGIFTLIIGLFGVYIYFGVIGVIIVWVLDALLHAFLGH